MKLTAQELIEHLVVAGIPADRIHARGDKVVILGADGQAIALDSETARITFSLVAVAERKARTREKKPA